jgi:nitrite reductase/ring-hydroxylating ferredoxin subunit
VSAERLIGLCPLEEIADPGSRGLRLEGDGDSGEILLVRRGDQVFGYRNSCPHTGAPLDWQPHRFLDAGGQLIQCATHGALFRIDDGECLWGPCAGQRLRPLPLVVREGIVLLRRPGDGSR